MSHYCEEPMPWGDCGLELVSGTCPMHGDTESSEENIDGVEKHI